MAGAGSGRQDVAMSILRGIAVSLASLLLAAHLLRSFGLAFALPALALPMLLSVRRSWADRALAVALLAGAVEWVRTLLALVDVRRAHGQSWTRMAVILASVALVTAGAAALAGFRSRPVRRSSRLAEAAS
jgi:hypothetical protein